MPLVRMHGGSIGSAAQRSVAGPPWRDASEAAARARRGRRATCLHGGRGPCQRADRRRPARHGRGLDPTSWVSKNPTSWEVGTASSALAVLGGAPSTLAGGRAGQGAKLIAALLRQRHCAGGSQSTAQRWSRLGLLLCALPRRGPLGHGDVELCAGAHPSATQRQRCSTRLTLQGSRRAFKYVPPAALRDD
jgi:hypothetical protein